MSSDFYRAFEDKHRGSRDLIKRRLHIYLPFVAQLKQLNTDCSAVDLGCGRGEWIELLTTHGVTAHGVDLDEHMLAGCRELGLSVSLGDAVTYLTTLAEESQDLISGFHIAEHLPFSELEKLVKEAIRVLRPAGLLILETPNCENIVVGTHNFYLDPTHKTPIPSQLLDFLSEYYGFQRTKVLRLQQSEELIHRIPTILDILNGVSPDYAVITQKKAEPEKLELFEELFQRNYGLSLATLANKYERNNKQNGILVQEGIRQIDERVKAAEAQLLEIYCSTSWRVTFPLRMISRIIHSLDNWRKFPSFIIKGIKILIRPVLAHAVLFIFSRPKLKGYVFRWLSNYPRIEAHFIRFAGERGLPSPLMENCENVHANLSPYARQIYTEIKSAIYPNRKNN